MKKTPWIAGAALAAMLAGGAIAQPMPGRDGPPPPKTRAEVQTRITEHFKKADTNGDGVVTKAEADATRAKMREAFAEKREERRDERFAMLDTDKNGALSKDEFTARPDGKDGHRAGRDGKHGRHGIGKMGRGGGGAFMGNWFERMDANKDGKVTLAEAQTQPLAHFDRMDSNKDGTLSPEEHKAARQAMRGKWKEGREGRPAAPAPAPKG
ncbi:MAG: EF-hand domain-containing protein [Pseudomonadota bacterium]